jgi:hypothetical protein
MVSPSALSPALTNAPIFVASENCESSFRRIVDFTDEPSASGSDAAPFVGEKPSKKAHSLKRKRADGALDTLDPRDFDSDEQPERYKRVQVYCRPPAGLDPVGALEREAPCIINPTATVSDPMVLDTDESQSVSRESNDAAAATEPTSLVLDVPRHEQQTLNEVSYAPGRYYDSDDVLSHSPLLEPIRPNYNPAPTPPPFVSGYHSSSDTCSSPGVVTPPSTDLHPPFSGRPLSKSSKRKKRRRHGPSQGDIVLICYLEPNRPDFAQ